jgi:hypothetical protein
MSLMIRTQISLTEKQMRRLRDAADRRGISMAQVVRDAVEEHLSNDPDDRGRRWDRAIGAAGAHRSDTETGTAVSRDHDAHLADAYERPAG